MARSAKVEHQIVGDIDQRVDRLLPRRLQPRAHPRRARLAVIDPAHRPREEGRAALGILDPHRDGIVETALDQRHVERLQRAEPGRRQVARNPAHPHAILPIGGDRHIEHRIVDPGIIGKTCPHRGIGGKLDDPVMLLAEHKLAHRTHHSVRLDPANRRLLQRHVAARHISPGPAEHADHPGARIGRPADHLQRFALAGIDAQHLQLVGLRMRRGAQHFRDHEWRQRLGRILNPFDLQPDLGQLVGHGADIGRRVEMRFQP